MIDKRFEQYYDVFFSIFIGIVIILISYNLYDSPRTITFTDTDIDTNSEYFNNINNIKNIRNGCDLNEIEF